MSPCCDHPRHARPAVPQLAAIIRGQISSGELPPGSQPPSALYLAGTYQVAVPPARKAISVLKDQGLVIGVAGYGTLVSDGSASRRCRDRGVLRPA